MALSTEKLPNNPITGSELMQLCVTLLRDELIMRSVPGQTTCLLVDSMEHAMKNDFLFAATAAYPGISLEIAVKLHRSGDFCAFAIKPVFKHMSNTFPEHTVFVRTPAAPPLDVHRSDDEQVECFTLAMKIDNPNSIRVHYGIPIIRQIREEPKPGEMFGQFRTETLEYNPEECGPKPLPSVIDESEQYERMWGVVKEVVSAESSTDLEPAVTVAAESTASDSAAPQKHHGQRKGWNKTVPESK